jgi:oligopeptide transport system substrate-binding protein
MTGTGKYANASNEVKLSILAQIEENFIELYYCIPVCATTVCSMLSYKLSYYTENYSIMYGFGGLRLIRYNYDDAAWDAYVAENNNQLKY